MAQSARSKPSAAAKFVVHRTRSANEEGHLALDKVRRQGYSGTLHYACCVAAHDARVPVCRRIPTAPTRFAASPRVGYVLSIGGEEQLEGKDDTICDSPSPVCIPRYELCQRIPVYRVPTTYRPVHNPSPAMLSCYKELPCSTCRNTALPSFQVKASMYCGHKPMSDPLHSISE
jgi:hypothetical protein